MPTENPWLGSEEDLLEVNPYEMIERATEAIGNRNGICPGCTQYTENAEEHLANCEPLRDAIIDEIASEDPRDNDRDYDRMVDDGEL